MPLNSKDSYSRVAYFWVQHLNVTFLAKKDPKKSLQIFSFENFNSKFV